MPAKTIAAFVGNAIASGLDPATPAAAVFNATRPDEIVIAAPIADLPARLAATEKSGPVIVMIGRVLAERAAVADEPSLRSSESAR